MRRRAQYRTPVNVFTSGYDENDNITVCGFLKFAIFLILRHPWTVSVTPLPEYYHKKRDVTLAPGFRISNCARRQYRRWISTVRYFFYSFYSHSPYRLLRIARRRKITFIVYSFRQNDGIIPHSKTIKRSDVSFDCIVHNNLITIH